MATKMTKRDKFEMLLALGEVQANPVLVEFVERELELLAKKNSGEHKETANQIANGKLKESILGAMEHDTAYTATEIAELPELAGQKLSNQKVTSLLSQLVKSGAIVRTMEKRKAYFSLA